MKNKDLVKKALKELSACDFNEDNRENAKRLLVQFLMGSKAASAGKFDLSKFVSKDSLRLALTGIFHDEDGYKVATNAHILCAIRSEISENCRGKIITPKGEMINENFPNWRAVVPAVTSESKVINILSDPKDFIGRVKFSKVRAKAEGLKIIARHATKDGECSYWGVDHLLKFATFLKAFPMAKVYYFGSGLPTIMAADENGNKCLLVSCVGGEDLSGYIIINA